VGGEKPAKIYRDFTQLHISIANISGTDEDIDKRKTALSTTIPPTFGQKNLVNFGPLTTELTRLMFTNPNSTSLKSYISASRGRCRLKFLHALENDQGFLGHTALGTRVPQQFLTMKLA